MIRSLITGSGSGPGPGSGSISILNSFKYFQLTKGNFIINPAVLCIITVGKIIVRINIIKKLLTKKGVDIIFR